MYIGTLHKRKSSEKTRKIGIPSWVVREAKEIIENKVSKDIWLLFIMAPYIFLNRDDNHFIPLFETTKMVANAEENIVDNWSV